MGTKVGGGKGYKNGRSNDGRRGIDGGGTGVDRHSPTREISSNFSAAVFAPMTVDVPHGVDGREAARETAGGRAIVEDVDVEDVAAEDSGTTRHLAS